MSAYCKVAETDGPAIRSSSRGLVLRSRSPGYGWSVGVPGHGLDAQDAAAGVHPVHGWTKGVGRGAGIAGLVKTDRRRHGERRRAGGSIVRRGEEGVRQRRGERRRRTVAGGVTTGAMEEIWGWGDSRGKRRRRCGRGRDGSSAGRRIAEAGVDRGGAVIVFSFAVPRWVVRAGSAMGPRRGSRGTGARDWSGGARG
jgi:hypothetical protein